jgi:hypothetical protein
VAGAFVEHRHLFTIVVLLNNFPFFRQTILQADCPPTKPGPAASSVKPGNTISITNTVTQVGQITWQKLSNRIILKYIKQIEEVKNAVKVPNNAISGREKSLQGRGENC